MLGKSRRRHPPRGAKRGRPRGSRRGGGTGSLGRSDTACKNSVGGKCCCFFLFLTIKFDSETKYYQNPASNLITLMLFKQRHLLH